jgi:hypothetical protein
MEMAFAATAAGKIERAPSIFVTTGGERKTCLRPTRAVALRGADGGMSIYSGVAPSNSDHGCDGRLSR